MKKRHKRGAVVVAGVASHLKKMLLRIRNIWQVTVRRGDNVSGRSCNLLTSRKMLQRIRNVLQGT